MLENKTDGKIIELLNLSECFIYDLKQINSILICISMTEKSIKSKSLLDAIDAISKNLDTTIKDFNKKSDFVRSELKR